MKKKTTAGWGRPPAQWMYELAELDRDNDALLDYEQLSEMYGIGKRAIQHFFVSLQIPIEFRKSELGGVRRVFRVVDLKREIKAYIRA